MKWKLERKPKHPGYQYVYFRDRDGNSSAAEIRGDLTIEDLTRMGIRFQWPWECATVGRAPEPSKRLKRKLRYVRNVR